MVKLGLYKLQVNFNEPINLPLTVVCFLEFDGHIDIGTFIGHLRVFFYLKSFGRSVMQNFYCLVYFRWRWNCYAFICNIELCQYRHINMFFGLVHKNNVNVSHCYCLTA